MNFFVELVISFTFAGLVQKSRVLGFDIYGHICQAGALLEILLTLVPSILYILQQSNSYNSPTLNWLLDSIIVVENEICFISRTIFQLPFMCSCCMWNLFLQNCVKFVSICVFLVFLGAYVFPARGANWNMRRGYLPFHTLSMSTFCHLGWCAGRDEG